MVSRKARRPIAADDVRRVFDAACFSGLAKLARLPASTNLERLASDVRATASIYAKEAREPDANEVHREIEAFYYAALRRQYERAASLRKNLSPQALAWFKARLDRPGPRRAELILPSAERLPWYGTSAGRLPRQSSGASINLVASRPRLRNGRNTLSDRRRDCPRPHASVRQAVPSDISAAAARA